MPIFLCIQAYVAGMNAEDDKGLSIALDSFPIVPILSLQRYHWTNTTSKNLFSLRLRIMTM